MSNDNVILGAVAEVIKDLRDELRKEIAEGPASVNDKLYKSILYRRGTEARDAIHGFTDAYLHQKAHALHEAQTPAAIMKRCMA